MHSTMKFITNIKEGPLLNLEIGDPYLMIADQLFVVLVVNGNVWHGQVEEVEVAGPELARRPGKVGRRLE